MGPDSPTGGQSKPPLDLGQLDRYLAGELPPAEARAFSRTLAAHPAFAALAHHLRTLAPTTGGTIATDRAEGQALIAARLDAAAHRAAAGASAVSTLRPPGRVAHLWRQRVGGGGSLWAAIVPARAVQPVAAIAAVGVIALGIGLTIRSVSHGVPLASPEREYVTAAGQRLSVTLADGTQLTLAPVSRVRLAPDYGRSGARRDVELAGEAYFAVVHDATRPFAVRTHDAVVRDIGTRFDVRAYPDDVGARIAVVEGEVAVRAFVGASRNQPLGEGSSAAVADEPSVGARDVAMVGGGRVSVVRNLDVASLTAWTEGRLAFDSQPVDAVLADVGRWYGVNLTLGDDSLRHARVTATYTNAPLDEVLASLAASLDAHVERSGPGGRVITLTRLRGGKGA